VPLVLYYVLVGTCGQKPVLIRMLPALSMTEEPTPPLSQCYISTRARAMMSSVCASFMVEAESCTSKLSSVPTRNFVDWVSAKTSE
jgi:hypothetical protein